MKSDWAYSGYRKSTGQLSLPWSSTFSLAPWGFSKLSPSRSALRPSEAESSSSLVASETSLMFLAWGKDRNLTVWKDANPFHKKGNHNTASFLIHCHYP